MSNFLQKFSILIFSISLWAGMTSVSWAGEWQGTWDTAMGEFRIIENNGVVYGDFGPFGTLEGLVGDAVVSGGKGEYVRINIDRKVGTGTFDGFIELRREGGDTGGLFEGHYKRRADVSKLADMPNAFEPWPKGPLLKGRRTNHIAPTLTRYSGNGPSKADVKANGGSVFSNWASFPDTESRQAYFRLRGEAKTRRRRSDIAKDRIANMPMTPDNDPMMPSTPNPDARYNGPLAEKITVLKEYPASYKPKWIEVRLNALSMNTQDDGGREEAYGLIGLYSGCVTNSGKVYTNPFGGETNRVADISRSKAVKVSDRFSIRIEPPTASGSYPEPYTRGPHEGREPHSFLAENLVRRFEVSPQCLQMPDARFFVEVKSNLKEKDNVKVSDENFGFHSEVVYMDKSGPDMVNGSKMENGALIEDVTWPVFHDYDIALQGRGEYPHRAWLVIDMRFVE